MGTADIRDFIKNHPEHRIEGQHDIRGLNAEKITGTEADLEKIKSIFMAMLKDIKKDFDIPKEDTSIEELKKQMDSMKKQALSQKKKKQAFTEKVAGQPAIFFNYIIEEDEVGFDFCSRSFDIGFLTDRYEKCLQPPFMRRI